MQFSIYLSIYLNPKLPFSLATPSPTPPLSPFCVFSVGFPLCRCVEHIPLRRVMWAQAIISVEAELDHDGDFVLRLPLRQVVAPMSTGPLGGALAPLLRELVTRGLPCGQLAQHKLAPRRNSGKLILVLD